ncbi:MAG: 30S ribosomal protein S19e [Nanoarchaeota archaeon]
MTHILEVNPQTLIKKAAEELKKQKLVQPPSWSTFVKTSHAKERTPEDNDWWYHRSASVLRSVARLGPIGTQKLRTKYGSLKGRGHKPEHFYRASGSILRKVLQQLEKSSLIKQTIAGNHKGRVLTAKGVSFMDKIAVQIAKQEHHEKKA